MNFSAKSEISMISRSFVLYNMNKINDKDDSCEISALIFILMNIISLKCNCVIHFFRKLCINLIIYREMHLCFIL